MPRPPWSGRASSHHRPHARHTHSPVFSPTEACSLSALKTAQRKGGGSRCEEADLILAFCKSRIAAGVCGGNSTHLVMPDPRSHVSQHPRCAPCSVRIPSKETSSPPTVFWRRRRRRRRRLVCHRVQIGSKATLSRPKSAPAQSEESSF